MHRVLVVSLMVLGGEPKPAKVEVRIANEDEPGVFEVLDPDGGVLWAECVVHDATAKVHAADRYRLRFTRDDAGTLATRVDPARGVFWMNVTVQRHYVEVETFEFTTEIWVDVTRGRQTVPLYVLTNRGGESWVVLPFVWVDGIGLDHMSHCWSQGGRLEPRAVLNIGWLDETCLVDGVANDRRVYFGMSKADWDQRALRQRTYVVSRTVRSGTARRRLVPDAGRRPWCVCEGTEVGPEHERLVKEGFEGRVFRLRDGGVRVEQTLGPLNVGDHAPFEMPPGAADNPDFTEWR